MSRHTATVEWERGGAPFLDLAYSRRHVVRFDGGHAMPGSSSPHVVRPPASDPAAVDPEEAFVASLASCHMLWFLSLAAEAGFVVDRYRDEASGRMGRDADGRIAMLEVVLRPRVTFAGARSPGENAHRELHHRAHDACFIANSVRTAVRCEPSIEGAPPSG